MKTKNVPAFDTHIRFIAILAVMAVLVLVLSGYNYLNLRSVTEVTKIDELSGQRVACCVAWEADYLLTPRDDITLLRYDTSAEALLGLAFGQVDAMAVDEITLMSMLARTKGLEVIDEPIAIVGNTLYASYGAEDKMEQFNEFAEDFMNSDEYEAFHENLISEEFQMSDIPKIEGGEILKVGYFPENYPESYIDFTTNEPMGYGIEIIERFAYKYGYTIEWTELTETSCGILLKQNKIDFAVAYVTDVYRDETEATGNALMTDLYDKIGVYLVKVKDGMKMEITGEIVY